jgi:DNA invertase Pin-like site-specific DNA recombinase
MKSKAIYLRVSKEELDEQTQLPEILKKFKLSLKDVDLYIERFSAYKEDLSEKRKEFKRMREGIEEGKIKEVYVYAFDRIYRDMMRLIEFVAICDTNNCEIFSVHYALPKKKESPSPVEKLTRILLTSIYGYSAENESYMISKRTEKTVDRSNGVTFSYKGNKWGTPFKDEEGNKVLLKPEIEAEMKSFCKKKIEEFERMGYKFYYDLVLDDVSKKYGVFLSKAYLSKLKND